MATNEYFYKKSSSILDYGVDWSFWLNANNDTISTHEWVVPPGITVIEEDNNETLAVIEIDGGVPGEIYTLKSKIVTSSKELEECQPIYIKINDLTC